MIETILFVVFGAAAVASSLLMITRTKPVHAAISFLGTLVSLAGLFLLMFAQFVAVLQIIVYAGAILVLFLFVIMMLHVRSGEGPEVKLRFQRPLALALATLLGLGLVYVAAATDLSGVRELPDDMGTVEAIGEALFTQYLLPFEVAAVLLLIGLLGAVALTSQDDDPSDEEGSS